MSNNFATRSPNRIPISADQAFRIRERQAADEGIRDPKGFLPHDEWTSEAQAKAMGRLYRGYFFKEGS